MSFFDLFSGSLSESIQYLRQQLQIELLDLQIWYQKRRWSLLLIQQGKQELQSGQDGLFPLTISMIAKMAYADSVLSDTEHHAIEDLLRSTLKLNDQQLILALSHIRKARSSSKTFKDYAEEFYQRFKKSSVILENNIDILLALALADGKIDAHEQQILNIALDTFRLSRETYQNLKQRREEIHRLLREQERLKGAQIDYEDKYSHTHANFSSNFKQQSSRTHTRTQEQIDLENFYRVLGCKTTDSLQTIKSRYRKLVMKHHPDRYASEGLTEEMQAFSLERFREIQRAYDEICLRRGGR